MKALDSRTFIRAFQKWLNSDETGENAERVARFVIAKAMSGHFAYFKLVIDLVDGKVRPSAEEEWTFESDCVLVVADRERAFEVVKAA
jgi:hypothetical protein